MSKVKFRVTVVDKILIHLRDFSSYREQIDIPAEVTQDGIARIIGVDRSHIALSLKKLIERGLVEESSGRIRGEVRRKKTYFLTPVGAQNTIKLKESLLQMDVQIIRIDGSTESAPIIKVNEYAPRRLSLIETLNLVSKDGIIDLYDLEEKEETLPLTEPVAKEKDPSVYDLPLKVESGQIKSAYTPILIEDEILSGSNLFAFGIIAIAIPLFAFCAYLLGIMRSDYMVSCCPSTLVFFVIGVICLFFGSKKLRADAVLYRRVLLIFVSIVLFPVMFVLGYYMGLRYNTDAIVSMIIVAVSLFPVLIFVRVIPSARKMELAVFTGSFLLLFGLFSIFFSELMAPYGSSSVSPFWVLLGVLSLLAGYELQRPPLKSMANTASVGVGVFIILISVLLIRHGLGYLSLLQSLCIGLWLCCGVFVTGTRFSHRYGDVVTDAIKCFIPLGITGLLWFLGAVLLIGGKYGEGLIEVILAGVILWYTGLGIKNARSQPLVLGFVSLLLATEIVTIVALMLMR